MFEQHFGFSTMPFRSDLEPGQIFPTRTYQELMSTMRYAVETTQMAMITGDTGAGKTLAVRALARWLRQRLQPVLYVAAPGLEVHSLYRTLLDTMGFEPDRLTGDPRRVLRRALQEVHSEQGAAPVLVVEEAHTLEPATLEELRTLAAAEMDAGASLPLILLGHQELRKMLNLRELRALNQRIWLRFEMIGMTWEEMQGYMQHHLELAGANRQLFSDRATRQIFYQSQGLPGQINQLALRALDAAFRSGQTHVDGEIVDQVAVV